MALFRPLKASEIECRIGTVSRKGKGLSLLLYKTARVDADILDETFGPFGWECSFDEHKGTLFCSVGIRNEDGFLVYKEDAGAPSDMEAKKGEASDAFKRACFKWGIGRELYTAPFIWVPSDKCNITTRGDRFVCYDTFDVAKIAIEEGRITGIRIVNSDTGQIAFSWKGE